MVILGVSDGVDAGAALVVDSELVGVSAQAQQDQVPRSRAFPWQAVDDVLAQSGIRPRDVDLIAVAGRFSPPFFLRRHPGLRSIARDAFSAALDAQVFFQAMLRQSGLGALEADRASEWLESRFRARGFKPQRVNLVDTHKCLAEAAYRMQPDDQALIIALHPMGDGVAVSVHTAQAGQVDLHWEQRGFAALHTHLRRCVAAMGLRPLIDDERVWGLAAIGEPDPGLVAELGGHLRVQGPRLSRRAYPLPLGNGVYRSLSEVDRPTAAASVLENLRRAVVDLVRHHLRAHGRGHLILSGAVFDTPRLCASVLELEEVERLWVAPAVGWGSLAAGAAMGEGGSAPRLRPAALGREYGAVQCERALQVAALEPVVPDDAAASLAELLGEGASVARFWGRAGFGRGGLGARAVLVRGDDPAAMERVRTALDLPEDVEPQCLWLDTPGDGLSEGRHGLRKLGAGARYGSVAVRVDDVFARRYPAVVTQDARVHLHQVHPVDDPVLHAAITHLHRQTGCAALAAFPLAREQDPCVALPSDAIRVWRRSNLAALVLGPYLVRA